MFDSGWFSFRWKVTRFVLVSKGKDVSEASAAYHPSRMLDIADKRTASHLVAALVAALTAERPQCTLGMVMRRVNRWVAGHRFSLALKKTEVIVLIKESSQSPS